MAKEKKAKELKDKKEQAAKEKRDEMKIRHEAEQQRRAAAAKAVAERNEAARAAQQSAAAPSGGGGASSSGASLNSRAKQPAAQGRDMAGLRVVQRAMVHVTGLSPRIAKEEILRRNEYFGQYGNILKVVLSGAPKVASGPPTQSCSITYASRDEAEQAPDPMSPHF